ncbi:hypothetical protein [Desulfopila sp. IMCC35008]|uniref:hypothetical protein n=1 Tax=Desulfopila sp. IMCC35008 TaxID=2653858 RepID=UPI0013D67102|nr:hypothetical protein [Desulfopila sp. IMCC35008]
MKVIKILKLFLLVIFLSLCLGSNIQNSDNEKIIKAVIIYEDQRAAEINKRVNDQLTHIAVSIIDDSNKTHIETEKYKTTLLVLNFSEIECETYALCKIKKTNELSRPVIIKFKKIVINYNTANVIAYVEHRGSDCFSTEEYILENSDGDWTVRTSKETRYTCG